MIQDAEINKDSLGFAMMQIMQRRKFI